MHGYISENTMIGEGSVISYTEDCIPVTIEAEALRYLGSEKLSDGHVEESHCVDSLGIEPYRCSSNGIGVQELIGSNSHDTDDYNLLLAQYYDAEEKRRQILQQLHLQQHSDNSHPCAPEVSGFSMKSSMCAAAQDQPMLISGKACCCSNVIESEKGCLLIDGDVSKTGVEAAEIAVDSMKMTADIDSGDKEMRQEKKGNEAEMMQEPSCDTELGVVLNAWYCAGFYTGKYLAEQSSAKDNMARR